MTASGAMTKLLAAFFVLVISSVTTTNLLALDEHPGLKALKAKDYATAMKILKPLAERGNAFAQSLVGTMYADGPSGVPQDYAEARKWLRKAAEQEFAPAQSDLGAMYYEGVDEVLQ